QRKLEEGAAAIGEGKRLLADQNVAARREAVRRKPADALGHYSLGVLLGKQGKLDEAIACYKEALRQQPDMVAQNIVNSLAWDFVAAEPQARDPRRAIRPGRQATAPTTPAPNPNPALLSRYA